LYFAKLFLIPNILPHKWKILKAVLRICDPVLIEFGYADKVIAELNKRKKVYK